MQQEIEAQQRHFVQLHQARETLREERQVGLPCLLQPPVLGQYAQVWPSICLLTSPSRARLIMQGAYLRPYSRRSHLMAASRLHDDKMAPVQGL